MVIYPIVRIAYIPNYADNEQERLKEYFQTAKDGGMMIIGVYVTICVALWKGDIVKSIWKSPSELIIDAENTDTSSSHQ